MILKKKKTRTQELIEESIMFAIDSINITIKHSTNSEIIKECAEAIKLLAEAYHAVRYEH